MQAHAARMPASHSEWMRPGDPRAGNPQAGAGPGGNAPTGNPGGGPASGGSLTGPSGAGPSGVRPGSAGPGTAGPGAGGNLVGGSAIGGGAAHAGGGAAHAASGHGRHAAEVVAESGKRWRGAHAVRAVRQAGHRTSAWAKRPSGRLALPGIIAVLLVSAAGTAGAYLVPKALRTAASPGATTAAAGAATAPGAGLPTASAPAGPSGFPGTDAPGPAQSRGRPADALAGWARRSAPGSGFRWWRCRLTGTPSW